MKTVFKKSLKFVLFLLSFTFALGQSVNYTASSEIIANPERGLQKYSITSNEYATTSGFSNFSVATLNNWKTSSEKVTVVYRYFILNMFMNSDINTIFLENIQRDFDNVRTAGFKIIVRFSYSNSQGTTAQQPGKSQILKHISQLSEILNTNKDIIFSVQAGFIGTWGEWYYTNSTEFGTDGNISQTQWANRKEIIDAMLAATPLEIPIQVRYAGIKTTMYGNTQLTGQTAYQNSANARIGFYNDAFLNDYGDQGTYSVSSQCQNPVNTSEYSYISNETKYVPMTGETNGLNTCDNGFRTNGENATNELNLVNWTTINRDYYLPFWDQIINSGHYRDIVKNIGYPFVLNSSTIQVNKGDFDLTLDLSNVGYARPFKKRNIYLILKNISNNTITTALIDTDIRTWESSVTITQNFNLGLTGTFQLYLWLPDKEANLAMNSDYSIQFANTNIWESETGYNELSHTITLENTLSVNDIEHKKLSVYPNPSSDFITIKSKQYEETVIQIFDINGKLIEEVSIFKNDRIDISNLNNGIYFINFKNNLFSHKFVKQ